MQDAPRHRKEVILVVDDDSAIRKVLQSGLELNGYQCFDAESAGRALAVLDEHPVDVVVADIRMPEMNGIELAQIVKKDHDADVIIMTGYVEDFNYEDIVRQGASDFIQKPVRIAEFIARLKRVLAERAGRQARLAVMDELRVNLDKSKRAMEGFVQAISVALEMRDRSEI